MKFPIEAAVAILTLTGMGAAMAQTMSAMPGMSTPPAATVRHGQGQGVIRAIDAKTSALTIQHGPIAALGWPGMTMTFKAKSPAMLKSVKVGQAVSFDVSASGASFVVTGIRPR